MLCMHLFEVKKYFFNYILMKIVINLYVFDNFCSLQPGYFCYKQEKDRKNDYNQLNIYICSLYTSVRYNRVWLYLQEIYDGEGWRTIFRCHLRKSLNFSNPILDSCVFTEANCCNFVFEEWRDKLPI